MIELITSTSPPETHCPLIPRHVSHRSPRLPTLLVGKAEKKLHSFCVRGVSRVLAYSPQLLDRLQALLEMAFFAGTAFSDPAGGARPQDRVCQSLQ
jgi:hypothetical protein